MEQIKHSPTKLARALNISVPYASQLLSGARPADLTLAARVYAATGYKIGPLENATPKELATIERFGNAI